MNSVQATSTVRRPKTMPKGDQFLAWTRPLAKFSDRNASEASTVLIVRHEDSERCGSGNALARSADFGHVERFGDGQQAQGNFPSVGAEELMTVASVQLTLRGEAVMRRVAAGLPDKQIPDTRG